MRHLETPFTPPCEWGLVLSGRPRPVVPAPAGCISLDQQRPLPLLFGLGASGSSVVRSLGERHGALRLSCWTVQAPMANLPEDLDSERWGRQVTETHACVTRVCVVTRLGSHEADLLALLADAWQQRGITTSVIGLLPPDRANPEEWDRAVCQFAQVPMSHQREIVKPGERDPWELILPALQTGVFP